VIAYGKGGVTESVIGIDDVANATGVFFSEPTPASLIDAVERYQRRKHIFEPAKLRRHAARFSRAAFKMRMKQFIEAKLLERADSVRQNAKTA
jgi:hypothetical protein